MCETKQEAKSKLDRFIQSMDRLSASLDRMFNQSINRERLTDKLTPGACGADPVA
jgi:hypothetical protein